jgi:hypothetical protein
LLEGRRLDLIRRDVESLLTQDGLTELCDFQGHRMLELDIFRIGFFPLVSLCQDVCYGQLETWEK